MFHWTIRLEGGHGKDHVSSARTASTAPWSSRPRTPVCRKWRDPVKTGHDTGHWLSNREVVTSGQAAVVIGHKMYCFGGDINQRKRDHIEVHVFNTVSLCWRKLTPVTHETGERHFEVPSMRKGYTAVLIDDTVYIWGGYNYLGKKFIEKKNVLHAFDVDSHRWFKPQVSGNAPEGRRNHSACVLRKAMYIHGGYNLWKYITNDVYKMDTNTMVWALINTRETPPPASSHHSATIIGTKMFVFGGYGGDNIYNNIRVFDTETNLWLNTPSQILPVRHKDHSAFTYNGKLYIFGGLSGNQNYNGMWTFSPETFSWKKVEPKGKHPHGMKDMCCCMVRDGIILFGADNRPDELYVLDFSPSLKTLCKLAVIQYGLEHSELPHNVRWELAVMNTNSS